FITQTSGDMEINTITTSADVSLDTLAGSLHDGRASGAGLNSGVVAANIVADNIDLLTVGGSIGASSNDLKVHDSANAASGTYCTDAYTRLYQDANYAGATSTERAVTAPCRLAAQSATSIYTTGTAG